MVDMTCCAVLRADVRWAWTACGAVWLPNAKPELKLRVRFIERERVMRFRAHEHGMRILNHNAYVPVGRAALGAAITCWKCFVILIADECCQHGHCTFPCETSSHARRGSWPHNDTPHELYSLFIKSRDANGNAALSCRRRDPGHSPRTRQNGFHLLGQPVLGGLADGLPDLRRDGQRIVRTALGGRLGGRLTRQPNGRPRGLDGSEHRGRLALKVVY